MSDSETNPTVSTTAPPSDDHSSAEGIKKQASGGFSSPSDDHYSAEGTKKQTSSSFSFSIWPPTQRTRDAIITRLIETLSTTSVLSKRYGTIPQEEASEASRRIEEEAFSVATTVASSEKDGLEVLQLYSKEISKRMLETVKARAGSGANGDNSATETASADVTPKAVANEEVSSSAEAEA